MSSTLSERSDSENQRNLERFTPLLYQMGGSTDSEGITRSASFEIVGQEPGAYAYPSNEKRISGNGFNTETEEIIINLNNGLCFKPIRLL